MSSENKEYISGHNRNQGGQDPKEEVLEDFRLKKSQQEGFQFFHLFLLKEIFLCFSLTVEVQHADNTC